MSAFLCSQAEALLTVPERLFLNASIPARTQSGCAPASGSGTDPTTAAPAAGSSPPSPFHREHRARVRALCVWVSCPMALARSAVAKFACSFSKKRRFGRHRANG